MMDSQLDLAAFWVYYLTSFILLDYFFLFHKLSFKKMQNDCLTVTSAAMALYESIASHTAQQSKLIQSK